MRTGHAAENFAILRHLAMGLLKRESSVKVGIKSKRSKAGWDDAYLLKVLAFKCVHSARRGFYPRLLREDVIELR